MGFDDGAVDQMQTITGFGGQRLEHPAPDAARRPAIEAIIGRRIGPVTFRQVPPRDARAQHVEDRVHDLAVSHPTAAPRRQQQPRQDRPFLIAQVKPQDPPPTRLNHAFSSHSRAYWVQTLSRSFHLRHRKVCDAAELSLI